MEVSSEEASLQRSQQLRELYDSLSAEDTNQPARRPCAALSPEDLTESEWFYLMSVSFSFPPGVGLPGKAFARQQHVWLTGSNESDSKMFSRAILAKSAGVQTVVCIPLMDGVVELGTTDRVQEDIVLIQHVKSFFTNNQHHPNPAHSGHSTSNQAPTSDQHHRFQSSPLVAMYSPLNQQQTPIQDEEEEDEEDEDEDEDDDDGESDSEAETGRNSHPSIAHDPLRLPDPMCQDIAMVQAAGEPSELMQLEMSEDIRIGSPDDGSINLESGLNMLAVSQSDRRPDSTRLWPLLQDQINLGLQPPVSETPQMVELTQEDTHYSQTVSTVLQHNTSRWAESTSSLNYMAYTNQSAFAKWSSRMMDRHLQPTLDGTSQWLLKYILFSVPYLHTKYRDEALTKSREGDFIPRLKKSASQDELSANHVLAERRRREKLNERFIILRSLVPFVTKMDKASILGDTIEYVKQLRKRIQDLEVRNRNEGDHRTKSGDGNKSATSKDTRSGGGVVQDRTVSGSDRRKVRIVEGSGGAKTKVVEAPQTVANLVQVSIIECDALLELKCAYKEDLLLEIMQMLKDLRMEITAVQSSSTNGVFVAELRAKVKENSSGKKVTIVEVKRAIHQIISQH
uniref:BHLH transcription factor TT8 n=1 Tax=Epimedium sagittatum TaxID=253616 RepID=S5ZM25_9MAGN|nr:bHLH transcription factor TT8 [Epimedium sagittatum]